MTKKRKAAWLALVLFIGAIPGYFWFFTESMVPTTGRFELDLAQVRALADAMPGEKPTEVRFEQVASLGVPSTGIVAGSGWSSTSLTFFAYQLVYADRTALIDSTMDKATAEKTRAENFDDAAFVRVSKAMTAADFIVVTHEHYDHIGGVVTHPQLSALLPHLRLTKDQLAEPKKLDPLAFAAGALDGYVPVEYEKYKAIAPGVVLIKAVGHTPGSQIVYVKRADGAEYLFLGDVAWHWRNVTELRTRARLVTTLLGERRDDVLLQLQALHQLTTEVPAMNIVPGHDKTRIDALVAGGFLKQGFQVAP